MKRSVSMISKGELSQEVLKSSKRGDIIFSKFPSEWHELDASSSELLALQIGSGKHVKGIVILRNSKDRYSIATYVYDDRKGNLDIPASIGDYVRVLFMQKKKDSYDEATFQNILNIVRTSDYPVDVIHTILEHVKPYDPRKAQKNNSDISLN